MIQRKKSVVETGFILEQYFGLSLNHIKFYDGRPTRSIKTSSVGVVVSIVIICILAHCVYITFKYIHEVPAIEQLFNRNSMHEIIRPMMYSKQIVMTAVPFLCIWIHFSKMYKLNVLMFRKVPHTLKKFKLVNDWFVDGTHIIVLMMLIFQNFTISYLTWFMTDIMNQHGNFPETRWQAAIVFSPIIYRLTIGQLFLRLNVVVKGFQIVTMELNKVKAE